MPRYLGEEKMMDKCEMQEYVPSIVCNQPAKHIFGDGSAISVCDIHVKWNPTMLKNAECPSCGRLADHYPCHKRRLFVSWLKKVFIKTLFWMVARHGCPLWIKDLALRDIF
jgi:hypothetical protein